MTSPLDHRCPRCSARPGERCDGHTTHPERRKLSDANARDVRYYDLDPTAMPNGHDTPQPDRPYRISAAQNELNRRGQSMIAAQLEWIAQRRTLRGGLDDAQWHRAQRERTLAGKRWRDDPAAHLEQPSTHPADYHPTTTTDPTPPLFGKP